MKKLGSNCDYAHERDVALMQAFKAVVSASSNVNMSEISHQVSLQPSPRFWVSEERATIVVSSMLRSPDTCDSMLPSKRRMYHEILSRVLILISERPSSPLYPLVTEVVNSPAPEFYLSPRYVRDRLESIRKTP